MKNRPVLIATRGSALALAQANMVLSQCRARFPELTFDLTVIRTSGDKLQNASMARIDASLPRGLFTKELETALLQSEAGLAVHSLKDLPTELPTGLMLGAVAGRREDVRDVLIYKKELPTPVSLSSLPAHCTVATSSTRRKAQLLAAQPRLNVVEIRGNVGTRLRKLAEQAELDATILAAAGLARLRIDTSGEFVAGPDVPPGLRAAVVGLEEMLPCVGQAAIGLEIRADDPRTARLCRELNDEATFQCVTAERALLRALGGGCQSPLGAYAECSGDVLRLRAVSFLTGAARRVDVSGPRNDASGLGQRVAAELSRA